MDGNLVQITCVLDILCLVAIRLALPSSRQLLLPFVPVPINILGGLKSLAFGKPDRRQNICGIKDKNIVCNVEVVKLALNHPDLEPPNQFGWYQL